MKKMAPKTQIRVWDLVTVEEKLKEIAANREQTYADLIRQIYSQVIHSDTCLDVYVKMHGLPDQAAEFVSVLRRDSGFYSEMLRTRIREIVTFGPMMGEAEFAAHKKALDTMIKKYQKVLQFEF